jgi:FkbM family methyltransferase
MFMRHGCYDVILDVGANVGQFVNEVRRLYKYDKRIISFEPIREAFDILKQQHESDPLWKGFNLALGDEESSNYINISKHSASSSILNFNDQYLVRYKELDTIDKQAIQIVTLDGLYDKIIHRTQEKVLLKIDTQGYEMNVLKGAENCLSDISGIQLEISVREVYSGEVLFIELLSYLKAAGFRVFTLEPYYFDKNSGELLQVEAYLVKD